tara:strand:- start:331 stop:477 length:147 start_codon:yes stop_codon:yes gene_type:complete
MKKIFKLLWNSIFEKNLREYNPYKDIKTAPRPDKKGPVINNKGIKLTR